MTSVKRIHLITPQLNGREYQYIKEALDNNWVSPYGKNIEDFRDQLIQYLRIKHLCLLNSGTAAIHLGLRLLHIEQGDEVLCPTMNFAGSVNPVLYLKAHPVFVDSEDQSWNIDPALLEEVIQERRQKNKSIKAIILVHLYGMPAMITELLDIANKYDIPVLENAADAFGSTYKNKALGTFGTIGVFSFNGNKIITTSSGGALVAHDEYLIEKAAYLANQAREFLPEYHHKEMGYNYMMSNILAGIGKAQLENIEERLAKKRAIFEYYQKELSGYEFVSFPKEKPYARSNRWLSTLLIDPDKVPDTLQAHIYKRFLEENIEIRPLWKPMHKQPAYQSFPYYVNGISEYLSKNGICLPSGTGLTQEDLERICDLFHSCIKTCLS
jgi:dTDP-4-amino-4,6-dideoxygalactose transaminase